MGLEKITDDGDSAAAVAVAAASAAAAAAAAASAAVCVCVCSALYDSLARGVNDVTGAYCAERAWDVLYGVRVA